MVKIKVVMVVVVVVRLIRLVMVIVVVIGHYIGGEEVAGCGGEWEQQWRMVEMK